MPERRVEILYEYLVRDDVKPVVSSLVPGPRPAFCFPYCMQATESCTGRGNEARVSLDLTPATCQIQISCLFNTCQRLRRASYKERCAKLELSMMKGAALQNKFCNII